MRFRLWSVMALMMCVSAVNMHAQYTITWDDFSRMVEKCHDECVETRDESSFSCGERCVDMDYFTNICRRSEYSCNYEYRTVCVKYERKCHEERYELPDGDIIDLIIEENAVDPSIVEFVLEAGPNVTWYKHILLSDGTGGSWRIWTRGSEKDAKDFPKDNRKRASESLWSSQVHNGQSLIFTQAGFLGWWRDSYKLGGLDRLKPGTRVTFRWVSDHPDTHPK